MIRLSSIKTHADLSRALIEVTNGLTVEQVKAAMKNRESRAFVLSRMMRRYFDALDRAPAFGLVGVGAIAFAERRLETFIRRAAIV